MLKLQMKKTRSIFYKFTPLTLFGQWVVPFTFLLALLSVILTNKANATTSNQHYTDTQNNAESAATTKKAKHYASCMKMIDSDPNEAFDDADKWILRGGGDPAKHCAAAAALALGFPGNAALRLERLAKTSVQNEAFRATIYSQAGKAWSEAKEWDRASAVQSAAITLAPNTLSYWLERAQTHTLAKKYGPAIEDLTHILEKDASNEAALILRASVHRYMDKPKLARKDINAALAIAPENPEALLESGILYRLNDETKKARQSWGKALLFLKKESPTLQTIRRNIELLEYSE